VTTIHTGGTDINILDRRGGGFALQQGSSYVLLTRDEAVRLAAALQSLTAEPHVPSATPGKARLLRYAAGVPD
jgi:hypothetical protein